MNEDLAPAGVEGETINLYRDRKAPKGRYRVLCWQHDPRKSWFLEFETFAAANDYAKNTARARPSTYEHDPVRTCVYGERGKPMRKYPKVYAEPDHRYPISVTRLVGLADTESPRRGSYRRR